MLQIDAINPDTFLIYLNGFVQLLQNVVDNGASVSFLPPLAEEDARRFWLRKHDELRAGTRIILAALIDECVVGSVQIALAQEPNQPHRADVQKLLVHIDYRKRGIGQALMTALEAAALEHKRWLLVLDTVTGDNGERLYLRQGYSVAGIVPNYALNTSGTFDATTFMYKQLHIVEE